MASVAEAAAEHLNPSQLGTKEYWERAYSLEAQNFATDPHDEGQIWFTESLAEPRILRFLDGANVDPDSAILDVGTGNGHLLFELVEAGYGGRIVGIDYAPAAVELARTIARERRLDEKIRFEVADVIKDALELRGGFDVVLDKGTFDAISLCEERTPDGRRLEEAYAESVAGLMRSGGLLLVTSCNWTEEELRRKLLTEDFRYYGKIKYPSFSFGGQTGQTISSVCLQKI